MFSNYILGSPSVWYKNNHILSVAAKTCDHPTKVFIGVGSLETPKHGVSQNMIVGAKALQNKFLHTDRQQLQVKLVISDGASHTTVFPITTSLGLDWVFNEEAGR